MGCSGSKNDAEATKKSREIDRIIRNETKAFQEQIKLLLLGAGESGKSTIVKQMVIIHKNGFSEEDRSNYKHVILANVFHSINTLVNAARKLEIPLDSEERNLDIRICKEAEEDSQKVGPIVGKSIKRLWNDGGIQKCFQRAREFQLIDSAQYYMEKVEDLFEPDYIPSEQDVLRSRATTTGITETKFNFKDVSFLMVDVGGQRTERKKWIHCFEDVTAIIFIVALSGYDLALREDQEMNRMHESMVLFDSICNNSWFATTAMILFLNKKDIFTQKIENSPLSVCFPNYKGRNNYSEASAYVRKQFEELNKNPDTKEIYSHYTCATDTRNIQIVFDAVADVITKSNMLEIGLI